MLEVVREVLMGIVAVALLWAAGAANYRWTFGKWLKLKYWPLALGLTLRGRREPEWEWWRR